MIVLDTHVWVWWLTKPEKLPRKAARAIDHADRVGVPAICVWEVATKAAAGKLRFDRPYEAWLDEALAEDPRTELLPLAPRVSIDAVQLAWKHADPADRFIVATARVHGAALVTADGEIQDSKLVRCIWD
jgi:PIN domain nuclease of toxin-antitoxin system